MYLKRNNCVMRQFKVYIRSLSEPFQSAAIFFNEWQWNEIKKSDVPQRGKSIKRAIKLRYVWSSISEYSLAVQQKKTNALSIKWLIKTWKISFIGSIYLEITWFVFCFCTCFLVGKSITFSPLVHIKFSLILINHFFRNQSNNFRNVHTDVMLQKTCQK